MPVAKLVVAPAGLLIAATAIVARGGPREEFQSAIRAHLPSTGVLEATYVPDDPTGASLLRISLGIDFATGHFYCAYGRSFLAVADDGSPFAMMHKNGAWRPVDASELFVSPDPIIEVVLAPLLIDIRHNGARVRSVSDLEGGGWSVEWSLPQGLLWPMFAPPGAQSADVARRVELGPDLRLIASYIEVDGKWVRRDTDYEVDPRAPTSANALKVASMRGGSPLKVASLSWDADRRSDWTASQLAMICKRLDTSPPRQWSAYPSNGATSGSESSQGPRADAMSPPPETPTSKVLIVCGSVIVAVGVFAWLRRRGKY